MREDAMTLHQEQIIYLRIARSALAISIQLDRIARGIEKPNDIAGITKVSNSFGSFISEPTNSNTESVFFSEPEGLKITIQASKQRYSNKPAKDSLQILFEELNKFVTNYKVKPPQSIKAKAKELSVFFDKVNTDAENAAATGGLPMLEIERVITANA